MIQSLTNCYLWVEQVTIRSMGVPGAVSAPWHQEVFWLYSSIFGRGSYRVSSVHKLFRIHILLSIRSRSSGFGNFHRGSCFLDDDAKRRWCKIPCSSDTRSQVGEGFKTYPLLVIFSGFSPYYLTFLGTGLYEGGVRIRFL